MPVKVLIAKVKTSMKRDPKNKTKFIGCETTLEINSLVPVFRGHHWILTEEEYEFLKQRRSNNASQDSKENQMEKKVKAPKKTVKKATKKVADKSVKKVAKKSAKKTK